MADKLTKNILNENFNDNNVLLKTKKTNKKRY